MFQNIAKGFQNTFRTLRGLGRLSEKNVEDAVREIRMSLLSADVNVHVVRDFLNEVRNKAVGSAVLESLTPDQQFVKIVYDELVALMGESVELDLKFKPPVVIMLVGLQGSGKTTTVAKLAKVITAGGKKCYLVPADLKRPAAVEQLTVLGRSLGIDVYPSRAGDNPREVAMNAVKEATRSGYDAVLIDTAGRLHIDDEMMSEAKDIAGLVSPQHVIFVADSMTGQDAVTSAAAFTAALPLTGVILTKVDGDARGGAALSIRKITGCPILYVGVGEKIDDLEKFHPDRTASRILGMGDVLSLIETATKSVDQETVLDFAKKAGSNKLTLEDLLTQFKSMKKMGSFGKMIGMIPGMSAVKDKIDEGQMETELKRKEAIIGSMTKQERRNPKVLNGSRRMRIARGSGVQVSDVNKLIREFEMMQKMMKGFGGGKLKQLKNMMNLMR